MTSPAVVAAVTALISAFAAACSVLAAAVAIRAQNRWGSADGFLRISERFESAEFRRYRTMLYALDRNAHSAWSDTDRAAVNAWAAHLDLIAVLIQSRQLDRLAVLNMYGDVIFRTVYQIAPYCNQQLGIRGKQFLLPLRVLTNDLVRLWRRQAKRKRYPLTIGFPAQPHLRVNPDLFDSDDAILAFSIDKRLK